MAMSEERFDRIDQTLAHLGAGLENVNHNVGLLQHDVHVLQDNVHALQGNVHTLNGNVHTLQDDVYVLQDNMRVLQHDMHVLHEDALSRIAAVAESVVVLDQKMERGFAEVRETIREEVAPLKAAVRHHAVEIKKLKDARAD
jgi:predicted  nucleic acid-binding Zn-ribbon protein